MSNGPDQTDGDRGAGGASMLSAIDAIYAFAEDPSKGPDVFVEFERLCAGPSGLSPQSIEQFLQHAGRALRITEKLRPTQTNSDGEDDAPDIILLTSDCIVRDATDGALRRLEAFVDEPIKVGKAIRFCSECDDAFHQALVMAQSRSRQAFFPISFARRDSGDRCLGFLSSPDLLPESARRLVRPLPGNFAIVLAPQRGPSVHTEALRESLGLTKSEWELARALQSGLSLSDAAAYLGITLNTARSALKVIFAKAQVHRQSELVELLDEAAAIEPSRNVVTGRAVPDPVPRILKLADGRQLSYRDYGPRQGYPTLVFHTTMMGSLLHEELTQPAGERGIRLISFDRPGFGNSTAARSYDFASIAADARRLIDHLELARVVTFGSGIGGAFALETARVLGERVVAVALNSPRLRNYGSVDGSGLFHRMHATLLKQPWVLRMIGELFHVGRHRAMAYAYARKTDEGILPANTRRDEAGFLDKLIRSGLEAFEHSGRGLSDEMTLFASGASASPRGLNCPIGVWHGREHQWIPATETIREFDGVSNAELHILDGIGVYFPLSVAEDMMDWIVARWREEGRLGE